MRRPLMLVAMALALVATPATAGTGVGSSQGEYSPEGFGTITDGEATFTWNGFGTTNVDNSDFSWRGPTDHMFENSWYYRVAGDSDETVLGPPDSSVFAGNVVTMSWADIDSRGLMSAQLVTTLVDGGGGTLARLTHVLTITNIIPTGAPVNLDLFAYLDLDLTADATDDQGLAVAPDRIEQSDASTSFEHEATAAGSFQVTDTQDASSLRTLFTDGAPSNLNNSGLPFGPADMEMGLQWTATINTGASMTFTRVEELTDSVKIPVELTKFDVE